MVSFIKAFSVFFVSVCVFDGFDGDVVFEYGEGFGG